MQIRKELNLDELNKELIRATRAGETGAIITVLGNGASPSYADPSDGDTALHIAIRNGKDEIIKLLLKYKALVNVENARKEVPIQLAVEYQNWKLVSRLVTESEIANVGKALLLLVYAIDTDKELEKEVEEKIEKEGKGKEKEKNEKTSLEALNALLLKGKPIFNIKFDEDGSYCLHEAVLKNDCYLIRELIEAGSPINQRNKKGQTPFQLAIRKKYFNCAVEIAKHAKIEQLPNSDVDEFITDYNRLIMSLVDNSEDFKILLNGQQLKECITCETKRYCTKQAIDKYDLMLAKKLFSCGICDASPLVKSLIEEKRWDMLVVVASAPLDDIASEVIKNNLDKIFNLIKLGKNKKNSDQLFNKINKKLTNDLIHLYCKYAPHGNAKVEKNIKFIIEQSNLPCLSMWMHKELSNKYHANKRSKKKQKKIKEEMNFYANKMIGVSPPSQTYVIGTSPLFQTTCVVGSSQTSQASLSEKPSTHKKINKSLSLRRPTRKERKEQERKEQERKEQVQERKKQERKEFKSRNKIDRHSDKEDSDKEERHSTDLSSYNRRY